MAINLSRNTKVWFTTNVNANTGVVQTTGFTAANTFELQVLDGYTFSQQTNQQTITLSEAGGDPVRGQRSFNTALNPVDFSMSTYIRPVLSGGQITPVERVLWNALFSPTAIDTTTGSVAVSSATATRASATAPQVTNIQYTAAAAPAIGSYINLSGYPTDSWNGPVEVTSATIAGGVVTANGTYAKAPTSGTSVVAGANARVYTGAWAPNGTAYSYCSSAPSDKNQLQKFGLIFLVDTVYYTIDNCSLNQATIDFGLDAIAMIAWSGNGTKVNAQATALSITATGLNTSANYITNKLSTVTLVSNIGGQGGTSYTVPLTGGSITFNNNITYLTPENLGVVNNPIGYYTGTRAISGTMNAYLRTGGAGDTGKLMSDILSTATTDADNKFKLQFEIGGSTNPVRVEIDLEGCMLQLPTIEIADVVSTTINFFAQGSDPTLATNAYDITNSNEAIIRYYSV